MDKMQTFVLTHLKKGSTFLVVGGAAFVADAAVFNALVYWGAKGPLFHLPLLAKTISVLGASLVSYAGSKLWTFKDSKRPASLLQFFEFMALNVVAILLQLGCLGFSRYVLHQADAFSDNLWGTFIGQIVATIFRYITYGLWVFPDKDIQNRETHETMGTK